MPEIKDMPNLKNSFAKRKRGNRLILGIAKNVGEAGMDAIPDFLKILRQVCADNNFRIRRDGVVFMKEYLRRDDKQDIIKSERFDEVYMPLLLDLLDDED